MPMISSIDASRGLPGVHASLKADSARNGMSSRFTPASLRDLGMPTSSANFGLHQLLLDDMFLDPFHLHQERP